MMQKLASGHSELVSVITAVKDGEFTIERCINSVFQQTHQSIEHIIVLGKSCDNTESVINN